MKILIVGNYSFVVDGLVQRLNREDTDIYLLSSEKNNESIRKKLPSHMDFKADLSKDDVRYIMYCVQPDVVIFAGAYADMYDWNEQNIDAKFFGELANVLHWCNYFNVKKVIYMSSMLAYENNAGLDLGESVVPQTLCDKQRVILGGEKLVHMYQTETTQIISLRFPVVFGAQFNNIERRNKVSEICYELLRDHKMNSMGYDAYSMIYIDDAVEAMLRVIDKEEPEHTLYHVPGTRPVGEQEIIDMVVKYAWKGKEHSCKIKKKPNQAKELSLNGQRFADEFNFQPFMEPEQGIQLSIQKVLKYYRVYNETEKRLVEEEKQAQVDKSKNKWKTIIKPLGGLLENLIIFGACLAAFLAFHDLEMFSKVDFFLIYILLMAAGVSIGNGILAVMLSTAVNIGYLCSQGYSFAAVIGSYSIVVLFLYRIIIALFVSYWILRSENRRKEIQEQLEDITQEYDMLAEINQTNIEVKKIFEDRLINYKDSIGKTYNIVSELDVLDPEQIVEASLNVIHRIMGVDDISIYRVASQKYCHHIVSSFSGERTLGNTIQLENYPEFDKTLEDQDIFMNDEIKSDLPRMAAPVYAHGKMIYIIMLWNMKFDQVTQYQKNLFMVLSKIIAGSMEKAVIYEQDAHDIKYYPETDIMRESYFAKLLDKTNKKEDAGNYTLLRVPYVPDMPLVALSHKLEEVLRESDRFGFLEGQDNYVFILAQCKADEVHFVQNKLTRQGLEGTVVTYG